MLQLHIDEIAQKTTISAEKVEITIGAMFDFLQKQGSETNVAKLFEMIPEASQFAQKYPIDNDVGGLKGFMAGLMDKEDGMMDALALAEMLEGEGVTQNQIRIIGEQLLLSLRPIVGDELIDDLIDDIPVLKKILA